MIVYVVKGKAEGDVWQRLYSELIKIFINNCLFFCYPSILQSEIFKKIFDRACSYYTL